MYWSEGELGLYSTFAFSIGLFGCSQDLVGADLGIAITLHGNLQFSTSLSVMSPPISTSER
jgi:hypothetical protein